MCEREVCIPLCCKAAAGLGSEGVREASGQVVVEVLNPQGALLSEGKAAQQLEGEDEEEEEGTLTAKRHCHFVVTYTEKLLK